MRIVPPVLGGAAIAALLAGIAAATTLPHQHQSSSTTAGRVHVNSSLSHFTVVPRRLARPIVRPAASRVRSWIRPDGAPGCIYLSDNLGGNVWVYSASPPYGEVGELSSSELYGWGVATNGKFAYAGTYADTIDEYSACTGSTILRTLQGTAQGYPYGLVASSAGVVYANEWPAPIIDQWNATGTLTTYPTPALEPLNYELALDAKNDVYLSGYNSAQSQEIVVACNPNLSSCSQLVSVAGGFPGGVAVDGKGNMYLDDQFGTLYSWSGCPGACVPSGSFTYSNGTNPLDYTAIALDANATTLWAANIFLCSSSYGLCGDGQSQSLPLSTATLGGTTTPPLANAEPLGIAVNGKAKKQKGQGSPAEIFNWWVKNPPPSQNPTNFEVVFRGNLTNDIPAIPVYGVYDPFCPPTQTCSFQTTYNPTSNTTTVSYTGSVLYQNIPGYPDESHFGMLSGDGFSRNIKCLAQDGYWSFSPSGTSPLPEVALNPKNCTPPGSSEVDPGSSATAFTNYAYVYLEGSFNPSGPSQWGIWFAVPYKANGTKQPKLTYANYGTQTIYTFNSGIILNQPLTPSSCNTNPGCPENITLLESLNYANLPPPEYSGTKFQRMQHPPPPVLKPMSR